MFTRAAFVLCNNSNDMKKTAQSNVKLIYMQVLGNAASKQFHQATAEFVW